jgi:CRP/FNR family transcriptional regulator, anaerobic regulatory protein
MEANAHLLFDPQSDAPLANRLRELGTSRTFAAGETILDTGRYIRSIPIVLRGRIRVSQRDDEGRDRTLFHILPGEGCVSVFSGTTGEVSVVTTTAEETSEVLLIPIEKANALVQEFPQFTAFIFQLYHKRFEELLHQLQEQGAQPMTVRLHNLLHRKQELSSSNELHITHQQLANELGTAREVVSRTLKHLEKAGELELGRNRIRLLR